MVSTNSCVVGIDYSTSSPCICISAGNDYDFHYLTKVKKHVGEKEFDHGIIEGTYLPKQFDSKIEQYSFIANWAIDVLDRYTPEVVWLED